MASSPNHDDAATVCLAADDSSDETIESLPWLKPSLQQIRQGVAIHGRHGRVPVLSQEEFNALNSRDSAHTRYYVHGPGSLGVRYYSRDTRDAWDILLRAVKRKVTMHHRNATVLQSGNMGCLACLAPKFSFPRDEEQHQRKIQAEIRGKRECLELCELIQRRLRAKGPYAPIDNKMVSGSGGGTRSSLIGGDSDDTIFGRACQAKIVIDRVQKAATRDRRVSTIGYGAVGAVAM